MVHGFLQEFQGWALSASAVCHPSQINAKRDPALDLTDRSSKGTPLQA
jgi:hypothetical protein